jgi:hypothetical protein
MALLAVEKLSICRALPIQKIMCSIWIQSLPKEQILQLLEEGDLNGVSYPDIYTENFEMKWIPGEDHMYVANMNSIALSLYNNTAYFDGEIDLENNRRVYGAGKMATRGFEC